MELARGARAAVASGVLELLRRQVEDRALVVDLGRREVQRVAHAGVDGQPRGRPASRPGRTARGPWPARRNSWRLEVDREVLDLAQQEAGQREAGARRAGQVAALAREAERPGRRGRLHDVEPLQPEVEAGLQRVAAALERRARPRAASRRCAESEFVLADEPSCWKPSIVNVGSASSKAAFVGIPGRPRACGRRAVQEQARCGRPSGACSPGAGR